MDPEKVADPTPRLPWLPAPAKDAVSSLQQTSVLRLQYCFCNKRKSILAREKGFFLSGRERE